MPLEQIGVILTVLANVGFVASFLISYARSKRRAGEKMARLDVKVQIMWAYHSKHHMGGGDLSSLDLDEDSQTTED